jgi:hypothetical protein
VCVPLTFQKMEQDKTGFLYSFKNIIVRCQLAVQIGTGTRRGDVLNRRAQESEKQLAAQQSCDRPSTETLVLIISQP